MTAALPPLMPAVPTAAPARTVDVAARVAARTTRPLGGFSWRVVGVEFRRLLRNRRSLIFTVLMPIMFLVIFSSQAFGTATFPHGNLPAYMTVGIALYGAVMATSSSGAAVSLERAVGWSRQLRLTPMSPGAYVATKLITAMGRSLLSVVVLYAGALILGHATMTTTAWVSTFVIVWLGSVLFAAFGLLLGYLLTGEMVMQIMSFALTIFSFAGGIFIPLSMFPGWLQTVAEFTPLWGLHQIAVLPITGEALTWQMVANVVGWFVIFAGGAALRFRKDTQRV